VTRRKLTAKAREHARFVLKHSSLAELDPKIETLVSKIDPEYRESIEAALSGPKLLAVARAATTKGRKGRPIKAETQLWILKLGQQKRKRLPYVHLTEEFRRPDESFEHAYVRLRKFCNTHRAAINSAAELPST
jgi:hypothetical protein